MFSFTFGDVGSGKSLSQAKDGLWLLGRSVYIQKKYKLPLRQVLSNTHFSDSITDKYKDRLVYWHDPLEMIFTDYPLNKHIRRDFDVLWDEMAVDLPSDKWKDTDPEVRRFFAQHRKRGIQIYGNTQDYMMVDINARRMATEVWQTHKIIGNRDPSSTLPKINTFWGLILKWQLDKQCIRADDMDRRHIDILPEIIWISKKLVLAFDTSEDIYKTENMFYQHKIKMCQDPNCKSGLHGTRYTKIIHV